MLILWSRFSSPCVGMRNKMKHERHIQIKRLVGRSTQASVASKRHRLSLLRNVNTRVLVVRIVLLLCWLVNINCGSTINVVNPEPIGVFLISRCSVKGPVPWPKAQPGDSQGSFQRVRKRSSGTKPLPGIANSHCKLQRCEHKSISPWSRPTA